MPEDKDEIKIDRVRMLAESDQAAGIRKIAWLRSPRVEEFVSRLETKAEIAGLIFKDNVIGFVLSEKKANG